MKNIIPVDVTNAFFNISDTQKVSECLFSDDTQKGFSGLNVGIISMETDPPHGGEVHFDGDEIIHVISGVLKVVSDSNPNESLRLSAGDSCIIKKAEWHKIYVIEKAKLIYITPAKNNDHRAN
ncbi:MAG: cupin domain-containing protein [Colwellia sp.]|nr:cupin domain-containing protein [Colwellia sp.]